MAEYDGKIVLGITTKVDDSLKKSIADIKKQIKDAGSVKEEIGELNKLIEEQKAKIKSLGIELGRLNYHGEGTSDRAKQLNAQIDEANDDLAKMQSKLTELGDDGKQATEGVASGLQKMQKRLATMAKNILVMQQLYKVLRYIMSIFSDILMSDAEFKQDWEELKAAIYTAAYPIVNMIVPALKWIVEKARNWAISVGKVAAYLQGMSYSELVEQAEASKKAADNFESIADSAKETEKSLASFDKVEILTTSGADDSSDYSGFESLKGYDTNEEESLLGNLMSIVGVALAALGLILISHGAIAWGIGFVIGGAFVWAISEWSTSEYDGSDVVALLDTIGKAVSIGLVAIGIMLIKKGSTKLGIGFIVGGAALYGITEIWGNEYSGDDVTNLLTKIMMTIGTALAAIGVMLLVMGQIPLGLAFLAVGALAFVDGVIAANWDTMSEKTKTWINVIMALVGTAMLVLGVVLTVAGQLVLGISLLVAGVASLVTVVALNWNSIKESICNVFNAIWNWIKTYGMLVLGIILCLTGTGIGFGIALIIKWAKDNADEVPLANVIITKVREVWDAIKDFWNKYIAVVFTADFWAKLGKTALNGLLAVVETALNVITGAFREAINGITSGLNAIGDLVGIDWDIPSIPKISLPRLAKGAVIPANREFLAVLGDQKSGTNIEAPLSTIEEAVENVMNRRGNETVKEEHYFLNESELMSIIYKLAKQGERVQGLDLAGG